QGGFAFGKIVAGILAVLAAAAAIVQRVVDDLEGDAEIAAVAFHGIDDLLAAAGQYRRQSATGGEQAGRLAVDDVEVVGLGQRRIVAVHELHDFAFGQTIGGAGKDVHDDRVFQLHHHLECARVQKVAGQYTGAVAPDV